MIFVFTIYENEHDKKPQTEKWNNKLKIQFWLSRDSQAIWNSCQKKSFFCKEKSIKICFLGVKINFEFSFLIINIVSKNYAMYWY